MNKRAKKKNDYKRKNNLLWESVRLVDEYMTVYAHLVGRKNHFYAGDVFWTEYAKWNKSLRGRRTWSYLLKKNNIPKNI